MPFPRKQLEQSPYHRAAANLIEFEIEAVKFGRAGYTQPVA
jgi:hypothetical protein